MKTKFLFLILILIPIMSQAQIGFSHKIDSIIQLTTVQTLSILNRQLSGDTSTIINGNPYTIVSRYWSNPANPMAAQWIKEKFESYGLNARFQANTATNINVMAVKPGVKYPNQQFIICAHYDDMPTGSLAPGADDNASGTCAVIEAARLLAPLTLDYTVIFIAFDEEERGLYGSKGYADSAFNRGDSILGVINLDMIAWDSNNDWKMDLHTNNASMPFTDDVAAAYNTYVPTLITTKTFSLSGGSDHQSFWNRNYKAILAIETGSDFNAYYHTINDKFQNLNVPYFHKMTQASIAALLSFSLDYRMKIQHDPILSSNDTTNRIAKAVITSSKPIALGSNMPRLYYKFNNGSYYFVNASQISGDTFSFSIPGMPLGTTVNYYFAAQDSLGDFVTTLPTGGRGLTPPGTIAPANTFVYEVANINTVNVCSTTLPKPILDLQNTYDTIPITLTGNVLDINVNLTIYHTYDSDIDIYLRGPNNVQIELSTGNGGSGDNYINTTFDDEATTPIQNGTPPFTGSYKPEQQLSAYDGIPAAGNWILRVYDKYNTDQGTLVNYCIIMQHSIISGITGNTGIPQKFILKQNYPNPFNSMTRIEFSVAKKSNVKIVMYDMLGREVNTMINSEMNAGDYSVIFKDDRLSSGVYFYTMFADGQKIATNKMILSK